MLIDSKDKIIAFHGCINNWILHIYYNMSRNIDENYDKNISMKQWLMKTCRNVEENFNKW